MPRVDIDDLEFEDTVVLHDGKLFTGTSVEEWAPGKLRAEQDWEMGRRHGVLREYSEDGQLLSEVPYQYGVLHGLGRWWHPNGQLATEKEARFGTVLSRREWNAAGELTGEFKLDENDPLYHDVMTQMERERRG